MPRFRDFFASNKAITEIFRTRYGKGHIVDLDVGGYILTEQSKVAGVIHNASWRLERDAYSSSDIKPRFISYWRFMLYHKLLDFFYPIPYEIEVPTPKFIPLNYI